MKKITLIILIHCLIFFVPYSKADDITDIKTQITALSNNLGNFPAHFKDIKEEAKVAKQYNALKKQLDSLLKKQPDNQELLFYRGKLQVMGHNADYKNAWQGATDDLTKLLELNPSNVPALLLLGAHWVNSEIGLAPKAEKLFLAAQCFQGTEPLEEAQRGLFFALYYQGKIKEATEQAQFLYTHWANESAYKQIYDMALGVLSKKSPDQAKQLEKNTPKSQMDCETK